MSLRQKTISGVYWAGAAQLVQFTSQFIVTAMLARLLRPSDFGIVAMANVFINLAASLNDQGWGSAIIQHPEASDEHCSSVFWLNVTFSLACMGLLVVLSPVVSSFYGQPELETVLSVLTISFGFDAFVIVQRAINMKRLNYKLLARIDIAAGTVGGIAGIVCALCGFGIWSLVIQLVAYKCIAAILLWSMTQWKPSFYFSAAKIKDLFSFSLYMSGNVICNVVVSNIDFLLIGKLLGAEALGFYTLAFKLMMMPVRNISWIVSKVMFPAFSAIQTNIVKVRAGYLAMVRMVALSAFPVVGCIFVVAPEFVNVVVGSQWQSSIILIRILCVLSLFKSISILAGNIALSQGRADVQLKIAIINIIVVAGSIVAGVPWGIIGAVVSFTIANLIWLPAMTAWVHRMIHLASSDYFGSLYRQGIYMLGLVVTASAVKAFIAMPDPVALIVVPGIGCAVYGGLVYCFEWGFIQSLLKTRPDTDQLKGESAS